MNEKEELKKTYYHRVGKPAVVIYKNNKVYEIQYWRLGKYHRLYKPAIITYENKEIISEKWYYEGRKLSDEEIEQEKKLI